MTTVVETASHAGVGTGFPIMGTLQSNSVGDRFVRAFVLHIHQESRTGANICHCPNTHTCQRKPTRAKTRSSNSRSFNPGVGLAIFWCVLHTTSAGLSLRVVPTSKISISYMPGIFPGQAVFDFMACTPENHQTWRPQHAMVGSLQLDRPATVCALVSAHRVQSYIFFPESRTTGTSVFQNRLTGPLR